MFHQGLPCFPHAIPHTSLTKYARSRLGRRWYQIRLSDWRSGTRTMGTRPLRACVVQHNYGVRLYSVRLRHEENLTKSRWVTGMFPAAYWCVVQDGAKLKAIDQDSLRIAPSTATTIGPRYPKVLTPSRYRRGHLYILKVWSTYTTLKQYNAIQIVTLLFSCDLSDLLWARRHPLPSRE